MRAKDFRKAIPIGVKLHAVLLMLGFTEDEIAGGIEWHHAPALALRLVDAETGELRPHPNDPRHIVPLRKADHRVQTFGNGATTAGSDIGRAAKLKRLEKMNAAYREIILRKTAGEPDENMVLLSPDDHAALHGRPPETKKRKRPIPSRGFGNQHRPFPNQRKDKR